MAVKSSYPQSPDLTDGLEKAIKHAFVPLTKDEREVLAKIAADSLTETEAIRALLRAYIWLASIRKELQTLRKDTLNGDL